MTNSTEQTDRTLFIAFVTTAVVFILCRTVGAFLFDNNWSFTHWYHTELWYIISYVFVMLFLVSIFVKKSDLLKIVSENKIILLVSSSLFFVSFFIFQFDSFIYSGGNYRINQIAQVDTIIFRFYEYGTIVIIALFYKLFSLLSLENNTAGLFSWKLFSFLGTIALFYISVKLTALLNKKKVHRFLLFLLLFFGPQTTLYFGFVGQETVVVALLYTFLWLVLLFDKKKTINILLLLWLTSIAGVVIYLSLIVLVPPLLFLTVKYFVKKKSIIPFVIGLKSYLLLLAAVYILAFENFGFAKAILFPSGRNINHTYSLFSLNHIGDIIQIVLLFFPQIIAVKILFFKKKSELLKSIPFSALMLLILSCNTALVILEPMHSIVLDAIGYSVFLAPMAVLLAYLLRDSLYGLRLFALLAIVVPFSILPVYINLDTSEAQIKDYLKENHQFYYEVGTAIQDSYFYNKELDKANYWYTNMAKLSRDFLDLTAATEFASAEVYPDALRLLQQLKTKYQFWGEPRFQIATIQQTLKRFALARPEIDTCLMLDPYDENYMQLDYRYYLLLGNYPSSLNSITSSLTIYPDNIDFQTDLAIIYYRMKNLPTADSVATSVIDQDSTSAYAYLVKGLIADRNNDSLSAIDNFEKFIRFAPDAFETPDIRKRLNNLILEQR